jgi:hypothetical protein
MVADAMRTMAPAPAVWQLLLSPQIHFLGQRLPPDFIPQYYTSKIDRRQAGKLLIGAKR